jgi:hypothetical protein
MSRILLVLFVSVLALPATARAAGTDGVPLISLKELKTLPGTPVAITPPAQPKPCAPIARGALTVLPGAPVAVAAPALRK